MNVMEMADQIAAKLGMEKKQAKAAVQAVFDAMVDCAKSGDEVSIAGFGKFKVAAREARTGRNPATGETIPDRSVEEAGLFARQAGEGCAERAAAGAEG